MREEDYSVAMPFGPRCRASPILASIRIARSALEMTDHASDRPSQAEIDAGAKALRQRQMAGRITLDWSMVPNTDRKKWRDHSEAVLLAARQERISAVPASAAIAKKGV